MPLNSPLPIIPPRPTDPRDLYLWEMQYGRNAQPYDPANVPIPENDPPLFSGDDQPAIDYARRAPWNPPAYYNPTVHQANLSDDPYLDKLLKFINEGDTTGFAPPVQAPPPPPSDPFNDVWRNITGGASAVASAAGAFGDYALHGDPNGKAPITQLTDWWANSPAGIYTKQTVAELHRPEPQLQNKISDARTGQEIKNDDQGNYYVELPPDVNLSTGEVTSRRIPVDRSYAAAAAQASPAGSNNEGGAGLQSFFAYVQGLTDELKVNPTPLLGGFSPMELLKGPFEPAVNAVYQGTNAARYQESYKPSFGPDGKLQMPGVHTPMEPVQEGIGWMFSHPGEIGQHMQAIKEARNPANYAWIDTPQEREDATLVARGVRGWRDETGQPLDIISTYRSEMQYVQQKGDQVAEIRAQAAQAHAYSKSLTDLSSSSEVSGYLYKIGMRDLIPMLNSSSYDTVLQIAAARLDKQATTLEKQPMSVRQDERIPMQESILWDIGADIGGFWDLGAEVLGLTGKARRIGEAANLVGDVDPITATKNIARAMAGPGASPTTGQRVSGMIGNLWGVNAGDMGFIDKVERSFGSAWKSFLADEKGSLSLGIFGGKDAQELTELSVWDLFNPYTPDISTKQAKKFVDEYDELANMEGPVDKLTRLEGMYDRMGVPPSQQLMHPPGAGDASWKTGKDASMLDRLEGYMKERFEANMLDRGPTVPDALTAAAGDKNLPGWMRNAYNKSVEAINAMDDARTDSYVIRLPVGIPPDKMKGYQHTDAFKTALSMSALSEQTGLNVDLFNVRYANDDTFDLLIPIVVNNEDILERNAMYLGNPEAIAKANLNARRAEVGHELVGQWLQNPQRKEYRFDYDPQTGKAAWQEWRPDTTDPSKGQWLTVAGADQQRINGPLAYADTYINDMGDEVIPPPAVIWEDDVSRANAQGIAADRSTNLPKDRTQPRGQWNPETKRYEYEKFFSTDPNDPSRGVWQTISRLPGGRDWRKDPHLASLARSGDFYHQAGRLMAGNRIESVEFFGKLAPTEWGRVQEELGAEGLVFSPYTLKDNEDWGNLPSRVVPRLKEKYIGIDGPLPGDAYDLFKLGTLDSPVWRPNDPDNFWNIVSETQQTLISRLFNADGATRPTTVWEEGLRSNDWWIAHPEASREIAKNAEGKPLYYPENARSYNRIRDMVMGPDMAGPIPAPTDDFLYKWSRTPLRDTTATMNSASRQALAKGADEFKTANLLYNVFGFSNEQRGSFLVDNLQVESFDDLLAASKMLENPKSNIPYYIDWESVTKFDDGTMRFNVVSTAETGKPKNFPGPTWRSAGKRMQEQMDDLMALENPSADQVAQMRLLPELIETWRDQRVKQIIQNGEPTSPGTWRNLDRWDVPLNDTAFHGYGARYPIPYTPPAAMTDAEAIVGGAGTAWPQNVVPGKRSYDVPTKSQQLQANVRQSFFDLDAMYKTAAENGMTLDNVRFTPTGEFTYNLRPAAKGDPASLKDVVGNSHINYVLNSFIPGMMEESKATRDEAAAFIQNMLAEGQRRKEMLNPPAPKLEPTPLEPMTIIDTPDPYGPRFDPGPAPLKVGQETVMPPPAVAAPTPTQYDPKQVLTDLTRTGEIEGQVARYSGMETDLKGLLGELKASVDTEAKNLTTSHDRLSTWMPSGAGELDMPETLAKASKAKIPNLSGASMPEQITEAQRLIELYEKAGADPEKVALARGLADQLAAVDPRLRVGNYVDEQGIERGMRLAPEVERSQGYMAGRLFEAEDAGVMDDYVYLRMQPGSYRVDQKTGGITILDQGKQPTRFNPKTGEYEKVGPDRSGWMVYQDPREAAGVYEWQSTRTGGQRGITQDDYQMELRVTDNDMDILRNESDVFDPTAEKQYKQPDDLSRPGYPGTNAQQDVWNWFAGKFRENEGTRGAIQVTPASRTSYDIVAVKRQDLANILGPEGLAGATVYGDPSMPSHTQIAPWKTGNYLHGNLQLPGESYQMGLNPMIEGPHFTWVDQAGKEWADAAGTVPGKALTAEGLYWEDYRKAMAIKKEAEERIAATFDAVRTRATCCRDRRWAFSSRIPRPARTFSRMFSTSRRRAWPSSPASSSSS